MMKRALVWQRLATLSILAAFLAMPLSKAHAECTGEKPPNLWGVDDPTTETECGSCHGIYGPRYLSPDAWEEIMGNLSDHFGENAGGLDRQTVSTITDYLTKNGGWGSGGPRRFSETDIFKKNHDNTCFTAEKPRWKCDACHDIGGVN